MHVQAVGRAGARRAHDPDALIDAPKRGVDSELLCLRSQRDRISPDLYLLGGAEDERVGGLEPDRDLGQLPAQALMSGQRLSEGPNLSVVAR